MKILSLILIGFAVINIDNYYFNLILILIELNSERNLPLRELNPQLNASVYLSKYSDFIWEHLRYGLLSSFFANNTYLK